MRLLPLLAAMLLLGAATAATAQDEETSPAVRAAVARIADGVDIPGNLRTLETLAEGGDLDAHNLLGELYSGLAGVPRDRLRSCGHFRVARESSASAAHNYGQCLWEGAWGERQLPEARIWYARGGNGGFLQAKCALGNMLIAGDGGPADPERGLALCREAAEAGEPNAQADMGDHYGAGSGVARDYVEAGRWYRLAAAQDQRNAAFQLGVLHWNGLGTPIDLAAAGDWFERAHGVGRKDAAALVARAALIRAGEANLDPAGRRALLDRAGHWLSIAMREDPDQEQRAWAAVALARLSAEVPQPLR